MWQYLKLLLTRGPSYAREFANGRRNARIARSGMGTKSRLKLAYAAMADQMIHAPNGNTPYADGWLSVEDPYDIKKIEPEVTSHGQTTGADQNAAA